MNKSRWYKIAFAVAFMSILTLPLSNMNSEIKSVSENRKLAAVPMVFKGDRINPDLSKEVENWLSDRFTGRATLLSINRKVEAFMGIMENDTAFVGRDGWIFYKGTGSIDNYQNKNLFNQNELEMIKNNILKKQEDLKAQGIDYYVMICPDKNRIYGEYYPDRYVIDKVGEKGRAELLAEYLQENGIKIIYPLEEMMAAKSTGTLYCRIDTHWNAHGAFVGYTSMMKRLQEDRPELKALDINEDYSIVQEPETDEHDTDETHTGYDLLRMMQFQVEDLGIPDGQNLKDVLVPKKDYYIDYGNHKKGYVKYKGEYGKDGIITANPNALNNLNVALIRDSYTIAMVPYISETFKNVIYSWTRDFNKGMKEIEASHIKPDIIIEQMVERAVYQLKDNYKY